MLNCNVCGPIRTTFARFQPDGATRVHTGAHLDGSDGQPIIQFHRHDYFGWTWVDAHLRDEPDLSWGWDCAGLRRYLRRRIVDPSADVHAERRRKIASAVAQLLPVHDALLTFTEVGLGHVDLLDLLTLHDYSIDETTWLRNGALSVSSSPLRYHGITLDPMERYTPLCYPPSTTP
jgi:hypothetical protein